MQKAIIFDLDGTLANIENRRAYLTNNPKDWDGFFRDIIHDKPNQPVITLYKIIANDKNHKMIIVSGRPDKYKNESMAWLKKHGISYDFLYMRKHGDRRADYLIKREILNGIIAEGIEVTLTIDDRNSVVQMWREHGITCLQCADGDF